MAIIIPMPPLYAERILAGTQPAILQKNRPQDLDVGERVYIYETAPTSAIVGYFTAGPAVDKKRAETDHAQSDPHGRTDGSATVTEITIWWPVRTARHISMNELTESNAAPTGYRYVTKRAPEIK